jgi:hypothetical protein
MRDYTVSQYRCKECNQIYDQSKLISDPYVLESYCPDPECDGVCEWEQDRPAMWASVAVYFTSRHYGGPEEGGWYYTAGEVYEPTIRCFEDHDFPQIENYLDTLHKRFPERNVQIKVEIEKIVHAFPKNRPFYC